MRKAFLLVILLSILVHAQSTRLRSNVILFIADGLRAGSVNAADTPALWAIRQQGVSFTNSHSLFPTFTMANASAIVTGHGLGNTGVFSNVIWTGFATYSGTPVPFIENDRMLADIRARGRQLPTRVSIAAVLWKE